MMKAPFPVDEAERLKALQDFMILDTLDESQFDDLTTLASEICQSPISLISLIDSDRQWFKSKVGLSANETPRDISFCGHAIMGSDFFEVPDAELDKRFQDNPLYTGEPHVRFYAGAPLVTKEGFRLGTLCVIDHVPRTLTEWQKSALQKLAKQVMLLMESRNREKLLVEANSKFDAIVNNIPVMLTSFNDEGKFEWMNDEMVKELGWKLDEISDKELLSKIFSSNENNCDALKFMLGREKKWNDFNSSKKDGEIVHTTWTNVKLENGKYIGIGNNIHHRKISEAELANKNKRLDYVLDCASVGSWDWWLSDNRVIYDERWCEILGLDHAKTQMNLSTWDERVHPLDKIKAEEDIQRHIEGKTEIYENVQRMKHAKGHWVWILERGRISERSEDGKPIRFTGTQLNISNQKKVEQELRDNQEKVHAMYEGSNDAILMTRGEKIIDCNLKSLQMFSSSSKEELIGLNPADLSPEYQPNGRASKSLVPTHLQNALTNGIDHFEWTHKRINGESFFADVLLSSFNFQGENVFQATIRDITEKKNLEKSLEQQIKMTHHQSKLASIGQLASGVGHEINNPLAIVKGFLHAIEVDLSTNEYKNPKTFHMIKKINLASDRIANIVKGLRTFSRSDADQVEIFDMDEAIEESHNLLHEIYQNEGISFKRHKKNTHPLIVYGNKGRIGQVLMNLYSNAKDATEGQDDRLIETTLVEKDGYAIWTISDNGKGIASDIRERIFDPFFTTKDLNKGTGIGLSIVSSIIKEHEGHIYFESRPDGGTIFKIEIPIHYSSLNPVPAPLIKEEESSPRFVLKALVAEDEEDIRLILESMLSRVGIEVTCVTNGKEALSEIQTTAFDLLITDLKMPQMNGKALVEAIRSDKNISQPKIFLMTGGIEEADSTLLGLNHLVQCQIFKPFEPENLYEKIREEFPDKAWT